MFYTFLESDKLSFWCNGVTNESVYLHLADFWAHVRPKWSHPGSLLQYDTSLCCGWTVQLTTIHPLPTPLFSSWSTALKLSSNPLYHCLSSSLPVSPPRSTEDTFCPHFTLLCYTVCLPLLHCCLKNHLYSHTFILPLTRTSVCWILFKGSFNSFVSPVSIQPFSSLSSILLSFHLQNG